MKIKTFFFIIVGGLSISAVAQNAASSATDGSHSQDIVDTGNNGNTAPGSTNFNARRRIIEPGLNNPNLNNPNYRNNPDGREHGVITNGFGSKAITNGFNYNAITNQFGSGTFTNGFSDGGLTNKFGGYTNYGINNEYGTNDSYNYYNYTNRHRSPYVTDPRVMGNNGLNGTN